MRVAARRLLAALRLFTPLLELPSDVSPGPIRRLERQLGRLRDLDVLAERVAADAEGPAEPDERAALDRLARAVADARKRALRRASMSLERNRLRRLTTALADWLERPTCASPAQLPISELAPDLLLPILSRSLLHPGWQIIEPPAPNSAAAAPLHALRRRLKSLRYALECLAEWYGRPVDAWLDELHAMQDALGDWHDEGLLLERLREVEAPATMFTRALERAREALAPWPAWRVRYLDPVTRATFRQWLGGLDPTVPDADRRGAGAAAGYSPPPRRSPTRVAPDSLPTA
jgi:CHAD domain-containing protein